MPVGMAIIPYPNIIINEAINCPRAVIGAISPYPTVVSVTIAQYTLLGMLVKPLPSLLSTRYMTVPRMIQRTITKEMNTAILARLRLSAFPKLALSPINRVSFKILNTRNNLRALSATNECVPKTKREMYLGIVDRRSMIP